jgi:hypothetical protein
MGGVGRPRAFKSVEEVEEKINAYFNYCEEKEKPYTMSGLAYYLGIDRKTLLNYSKNEEYFHAIKKARDKVQMQLEECLYRLGNNSGVIFNLKNNFDWKDKMEVEKTDMTKVDELLKEIKDNASNE